MERPRSGLERPVEVNEISRIPDRGTASGG